MRNAGRADRVGAGLAALAIGVMGAALAQDLKAPAGDKTAATGSVIGQVTAQPTKLPVRFAEILLVPVPGDTEPAPIPGATAPAAGTWQRATPHLEVVVGSSGMDGSLRLNGVPPGDYLVAATKAGYVTPGLALDVSTSEDQLKKLVASLPTVHVTASKVATVSLMLRLGGVISGRVHFADGSPATGTAVTCEPAESTLSRADLRMRVPSPRDQALQYFDYFRQHRREAVTDEEGRYSLSGLPPGKYLVTTLLGLDHSSAAQVEMSDGSSSRASGREHLYPELVPVYAPAAFRRQAARIFDLHGDEHFADADIRIDPSGLSAVRGKVLAEADHHAPSGAMVQLRENGARDVSRFAEIEEDGSFQINDLPPGKYTLEVNATDLPTPANPVQQGYRLMRKSVLVGTQDVHLDDILLQALKPGERKEDSIF